MSEQVLSSKCLYLQSHGSSPNFWAFKNNFGGWLWWSHFIIPGIGRWWQKNQYFKAILNSTPVPGKPRFFFFLSF